MYVLYVTSPNRASAKKIAITLVSKELCSCINITDSYCSIYQWSGEMKQNTKESVLLIKLKKSNVPETINIIKQTHPFTNPCIIGWEVSVGSAEYIKWVDNQY